MTFIAVAVSPSFVFLSCDLRVTTYVSDAIESQNDWAMKATLLDADEVFGFTGLARIGDRLTDEWLAEVLAGVPATSRLTELAVRATETFRRLDLRGPQAFLGAGFEVRANKRVPRAWVVTNAWDDVESVYDPRMIESRFGLHWLWPTSSQLTSLWTVGSEDEKGVAHNPAIQDAGDEIEQSVRRDRSNPRPVMDTLALLNQRMASLDSHIGASAVVTSLPRTADRHTGLNVWLEKPDRQAFTRFGISANYTSEFRGPHPEYFRQPGLISTNGFSTLGVVSANQAREIGPDPHRGHTGEAFGRPQVVEP